MIRTLIIAALGATVAIYTLVEVHRDMTATPTFAVSTLIPAEVGFVEYEVQCQAIGADALDGPMSVTSPPMFNSQYPRLTQDQVNQLAAEEGLVMDPWNSAQEEQLEEFRATVRENTAYYCAIARENQQAELARTIGTGLVALGLVAIGGVATLPRPRVAAPTSKKRVETT